MYRERTMLSSRKQSLKFIKTHLLIIGIFISLLLLIVVWQYQHVYLNSQETTPITDVSIEKIRPSEIEDSLELTGIILPSHNIQIFVPADYQERLKKSIDSGRLTITALTSSGKILTVIDLKYQEVEIKNKKPEVMIQGKISINHEHLASNIPTRINIILYNDPNVFTVPKDAVQEAKNEQFVLVLKEDQIFRKPIEVIRLLKGKALIKGDITPDDQVIIGGFSNVKRKYKIITS